MKRYGILVGLWLVMAMGLATSAHAATANQHYFNCKNCHKAGVTFTEMGNSNLNVCLQCHMEGANIPAQLLGVNPPPELDGTTTSRRSIGDASNEFNHNPNGESGKETSHIWGVSNTLAAAGAQEPSRAEYAGFYSRYNTSTSKVTCSRCHNPHGEAEIDQLDNATGLPTADLLNNVTRLPGPDGFPDGDGIPDSAFANRLLMPRDALNGNIPLTTEQLCRACHVPFDKNNGTLPEHDLNGWLSHPLLDNYATFQGNNSDEYKSVAEIDAITTDSKVRLVKKIRNGTLGVGCTSCHGAHYVDSDSSTPDGVAERASLSDSDGHLLRSDGPKRVGVTGGRDGLGVDGTINTVDDDPDNTSQLRSNLCQSCHKYKRHGKGGNQQMIGCLDCHGGHSYNGGTPSAFVLKKQSEPLDSVPVRLNRAPNGSAVDVTFPQVLATSPTRGLWSDGVRGSSNGYCEQCHGDVEDNLAANGVGKDTVQHLQSGWTYQCDYCHVHGEVSYSFAVSGSAATCGDCHGFPPYLNVAGNRTSGGTDGGYAYVSATHNYNQPGANYKTEATTPHNTHAAGGTTQGAATDYIFATGTAACDPCHLDKAMAPTHNDATVPGSYRDIAWNTLATGNGVMTGGAAPNYNTSTWVCTNIYCHSNGGKRNATGTKVLADFVRATTPSWNNGDATIVGKTTPTHQCNYCHGNTAGSMVSGQKNNSASHQKHLGTGTLLKTYSCNACHNQTAASNTALQTGARLVNGSGKHVNGSANIDFNASFSLGLANLGSGTYNGGANGTCLVYCHSNSKGSFYTADWDDPTSGACGTCHQYYSGATPTGAGAALSAPHAKHLAITLPTPVTCNDCHGTNATAGTHSGHVDGAWTVVADTCNGCHGWESGEQVPSWSQPMDNNYCIGCHTGTLRGTVKTKPAMNKTAALTGGHNRPTASGPYPQSTNLAANKLCTDCHETAITNHVDGTTGNATGLKASAATCTTSCHGVGGSAVRGGIVTHQAKACVACHDPHGNPTGTANIFMIHNDQSRQNAKDTTNVGEFNGAVVFLLLGNDTTPMDAADSYDEDDNSTTGFQPGTENNADDICATCHSSAAGNPTTHNNKENTDNTTGHHMGEDCFGCHAPHNTGTTAFAAAGGDSCDDCHAYPPTGGAHGNGADNGHIRVASTNRTTEDVSECAFCHTGAEHYTYDKTADQASNPVTYPGRNNHGLGDANQKNVLTAAVGYNQTNFSCANACHLSDVTDGTWTDANGLNCTACHYYAAGATSSTANNNMGTRNLKGSHNTHFAKGKFCNTCHDIPTNTTHISIPTGTDIQKIQSRAAALQDEADVKATTYGTGSDPDPGNPTCAGAGVALGCHNTKLTPAWTNTPITCTNCHVPGGGAAADPTSGLHLGPITVSGKVHNNTLGSGCTQCHYNLTAQASHFNTVFEGGNTQTTQMGLFVTYAQTANDAGTCAGSGVATGCHSDAGNWARRWSITARDSSGAAMCANCHGTFAAGWNSGVVHAEHVTRGSGHSAVGNLTYPCTDCHVIGASTNNYLFTLGSNDWQMVEIGSTKHGDNLLQMNSTETGFSDAAARVGCANSCHASDADHDFLKSAIFTSANFKLVNLAGVKPAVTCYNCHGGMTSGTAQSNYWPDKSNAFEGGGNLSEDNVGRHAIHMKHLARAIYNEDYLTDLLNDATPQNPGLTSDAKQQALCDYCHAGAANHGSKTNLPAEVPAMYKGWLPKTADANAAWNPASNGSCSNIDCHNDKATSLTTNFTWYGTGTQNCLLCHNDIASTTAGTTGASHQAHVGAAAINTFGKSITCASCHGGGLSWEGDTTPDTYVVPTSGHINGQFLVAGGTIIDGSTESYSGGSYTDYDTRTPGSCGVNLCHNNGKDAATPAYTWQTAITGCAACHATTSALGSSHDPHLNASFTSTFRSTVIGCADCHDAASNSSMNGKTAHMDGIVNWKSAATFAYTGNASVTTPNSYGTCSGACHVNHLAAPQASPAWNRTPVSGDNCTICHASPPADGRHGKHMLETDYVTGCGNCHTGANNTTTAITSASHFDGTRNTGGTATVIYSSGDGTCTNTCHKVVNSRDWTSGGTSPVLYCVDCHQAGTIAAGKGALPVSGLHNMTANGVQSHNDYLRTTNGCTQCHATPDPTHINNQFIADAINNNDRFVNRSAMVWTDGAANSGTCYDNGSASLDYNAGAGCHRDNGVWKRLWSINADVDTQANPNPGQLVCDVCHGQYQTLHASSKGWREGSAHYASGGSAAEDKGSSHNKTGGAANQCKDCHAYLNTRHENGALNFSGNGTTDYVLSNNAGKLYCASCHNDNSGETATDTGSHTFPLSGVFGSTVIYVPGTPPPEGGCTLCHGNAGTGQFWPDGVVDNASYPWADDQAGAHQIHVDEIAAFMDGNKLTPGDLAQKNATCSYCHPNPGGSGHATDSGDQRVDMLGDGLFKYIIDGSINGSGMYNSDTDGTCSTLKCHARAPFTPGWYGDTRAPGNVTLYVAAGPVPRSIRLYWDAPGDDAFDDGTAYRYDIRMGSGASSVTDATNFDPSTTATNYVKGIPTVTRKGDTGNALDDQQAIIHDVAPNTTYSFALRTYDEVGNYGGTANAGGYVSYTTPAAATLDNVAPVLTGSPDWYGLDSATALDDGSVKLSWTRAEDHTMPITYDVWWGTGNITYGATQASVKSTTSLRTTSALTPNETYNFAVRAKDNYGNTDDNTVVLKAVTKSLATVPKVLNVYYANGAAATNNVTMQTAAHTTDGTNTATTTFIGPTVFSRDTNVYLNAFTLNVDNGNTATVNLTAEAGYITGASTFTPFSSALSATASVPKRGIRVVNFKFNGAQRLMDDAFNAGAGAKLAVRVSSTGGPLDAIGWGPTSKGGILTFNSQPVNLSPSAPTVTVVGVSGSNVTFHWAASNDTTDGVTDSVHYDVYGSANSGTDGYPYVLATGLTANATAGAPMVWDTQASGVALSGATTIGIKVMAGDTVNGKTLSHSSATANTAANAVNNLVDKVAPGAFANFKAETRPKQGSVYLSWNAPGDDGVDNGRALSYDIRYDTRQIVESGGNGTTTVNFASIPDSGKLVSEPYPDFGGNGQGYEVLGLADGNYHFAIKVLDEAANASPLATTSTAVAAGPKCGICHATPPNEWNAAGNHAKHGYTMKDCSNCHGNDAVQGAQNFATNHQDGVVKLGWKTASPVAGMFRDGANNYDVTYTQGSEVIYYDGNGGGGFNVHLSDTGERIDNGTCSGWSNLLVSGCHGSASNVSWDKAATLSCSACHGVASRPTDKYDHSFDDPSADVRAAPPVDNHGYDPVDTDPVYKRKYVGAHVAHLNYSFRLSKGDSCRMCHGPSRPGNSLHADGNIDVLVDRAAAGPDATWTKGNEDPVVLANRTAGSCGDMSPTACHPYTADPVWDSAATFQCINCHGMNSVVPTHVTDPNATVNDPGGNNAIIPQADQMPGNCTWCHVGGHPKEKKVMAITKAAPAVVTTEFAHNLENGDKVTIHTTTGMTQINNKTFVVTYLTPTTFSLNGSNTSAYGTFTDGTWIEGNGTGIILVANDARVGINYSSGGVHLKATIHTRGEKSSEAELCWGCHGPNQISEWEADNSVGGGVANNTATKDATVGNGGYNFGTLTATPNGAGNWIGASWRSGTAAFTYKDGTIRSTHSTDPTGTVALTGSAYNYTNGGVDAVEKIRCSNCHDVHNTNASPKAADGLDPTGPPYLRGTWMSNPYKEDGAPQAGTNYTAAGSGTPGYGYGAVPRASSSTSQLMGGYWIDQNSGSPTATWSYDSSAALCQLCHGESVDLLNTAQGGAENLWITGTNGHINSALGGSGVGGANIFYHGTGGRPGAGGGNVNPNPGAWMGFQINYTDSDDYAYGPRSGREAFLNPYATASVKISVLIFAWGNTVDASTVEVGYHSFSCSKCHNPHASRLPKLMITNCLDVAQNTWDNNYKVDATDWPNFNGAASSWGRNRISHLSTAQNCHRYIDVNNDNTPDEKGWNKVTPWGTNNP